MCRYHEKKGGVEGEEGDDEGEDDEFGSAVGPRCVSHTDDLYCPLMSPTLKTTFRCFMVVVGAG